MASKHLRINDFREVGTYRRRQFAAVSDLPAVERIDGAEPVPARRLFTKREAANYRHPLQTAWGGRKRATATTTPQAMEGAEVAGLFLRVKHRLGPLALENSDLTRDDATVRLSRRQDRDYGTPPVLRRDSEREGHHRVLSQIHRQAAGVRTSAGGCLA